MKIIYIIPARKNSRRLPGKHLIPVNGKPLICYTLDFIEENVKSDEIWICTDDEKLKDIAKQYDIKIFMEDEVGAKSENMYGALHKCLNYREKEMGERFDIVFCVNPSVPLRTDKNIIDKMKRVWIKENKPFQVIDAIEPLTLPFLRGKIRNNKVNIKMLNDSSDAEKNIIDIIGSLALFNREKCFPENKLTTFEIVWREGVFPVIHENLIPIDIDTEKELNLFKFIMGNK